jgi:uncharacterized protein (PEP-CTERM system associated)
MRVALAALAGIAGLGATSDPARAQAAPAPEAAAAAGAAPAGAEARAYGVVLGATFEATALDTRGRASGSGTELLVSANPSLTMAHRGGRVRGTLVYSGSLANRRGIDDREATDYLNTLSADYAFEVIEGIGFLDAQASVRQESVSSVDSPVGTLQLSGNRNEVTTVRVSPYLRGLVGNFLEYELRVAGTATRGRQDGAGDTDTQDGLVALRSPRRGSMVGWGLIGTRNRVKFESSTAPTITDRLLAEISLQPDIDWRFTVTGGEERTDVVGALRRRYENYGARLEWTPSPRTSVALEGEERYFGRAYRVLVEHRFSRSTFRLAGSRDIRVGADALGQAATLYDIYFVQFASLIPDPVQRDQFVLALIAASGRDRNEVVSGGLFGTGGISVQKRLEGLWTWAGPRLTLTASGFTLDTVRVDSGVALTALNDNVRRTGYAASIGWRFTPLVSGSVSGSRTMTQDLSTLARSDLKSLAVAASARLGPRTTAGLRASYSVFNGSPESYRETSLNASLSLRF